MPVHNSNAVEFLKALHFRIRLTRRYLELFLDCARKEFLPTRDDVQRDWLCNVSALPWIAGPTYRLTANYGRLVQCGMPLGAGDLRLQKELRRHEGRLKVFYERLCQIEADYQSSGKVLSDKTQVIQRHFNLQCELELLLDLCDVWLRDVVSTGHVSVTGNAEHDFKLSRLPEQWDDFTSAEDIPEGFRGLQDQIEKINSTIRNLKASTYASGSEHDEDVMNLCMQTRRLLLQLVFHLLTARKDAELLLKAAFDALQSAKAAVERTTAADSDPQRTDGTESSAACGLSSQSLRQEVVQSIQLLQQRYQILKALTAQGDELNCLEKIANQSFRELAAEPAGSGA